MSDRNLNERLNPILPQCYCKINIKRRYLKDDTKKFLSKIILYLFNSVKYVTSTYLKTFIKD